MFLLFYILIFVFAYYFIKAIKELNKNYKRIIKREKLIVKKLNDVDSHYFEVKNIYDNSCVLFSDLVDHIKVEKESK